jgi:hypothetical protein
MWNSRSHLGPKFNEGARQLWLALQRVGWTQGRLQREVGACPGSVSHWLFGERVPGRAASMNIKRLFDIDPMVWDLPPAEPFTVPSERPTRAPRKAAA